MASKINKGEILAKFFDDGEYTALFADGAVSAACGYAAGQQAYAVYQNGEAVTVKDVEKNIKVLEMAAQTGCPVVTFYNSVGAKLAEGLDVLTASAKLNAQIAKVSGVVPQVAVVLGVCGGTSALSAANADHNAHGVAADGCKCGIDRFAKACVQLHGAVLIDHRALCPALPMTWLAASARLPVWPLPTPMLPPQRWQCWQARLWALCTPLWLLPTCASL